MFGENRLNKRGSERAGLDIMPVIVRNYTDNEATIIMVDSNIQRKDILPSEKARAYAMKYEAMKHQGSNERFPIGKSEGVWEKRRAYACNTVRVCCIEVENYHAVHLFFRKKMQFIP